MTAVSVLNGTTATELAPAAMRRAIGVYNKSSIEIYIKMDSSALADLTTSNGWPVPAGGCLLFDFSTQPAVTCAQWAAIHANGSPQTVIVMDFR